MNMGSRFKFFRQQFACLNLFPSIKMGLMIVAVRYTTSQHYFSKLHNLCQFLNVIPGINSDINKI